MCVYHITWILFLVELVWHYLIEDRSLSCLSGSIDVVCVLLRYEGLHKDANGYQLLWIVNVSLEEIS